MSIIVEITFLTIYPNLNWLMICLKRIMYVHTSNYSPKGALTSISSKKAKNRI